MTPEQRDNTRAARFAAKWRADEHTVYPTDEAMAAAFATCVRPPDARLCPLIRGLILAWSEADTLAAEAADPVSPWGSADATTPVVDGGAAWFTITTGGGARLRVQVTTEHAPPEEQR